jgi:Protein of unknown function (DUF3443)
MRDFRKFLVAVTGLACAFSLGCGGGGTSSSTKTTVIALSGSNVAPIVVNSGPANAYANGAFASVTVCVPGTSTCQTIDGVLVDTGSSGLRILSSALTLALPQQKAPSGNPVAECLTFLGSYTWGPVQTADVKIAGEKASAVPIHVLSDTDFKVPGGCTSSGFTSADTLFTLGADGILGVGNFARDCGGSCALPVAPGSQNPDWYYECPTSGCVATAEAVAQQVVNPVALFSSDNNGVVIELPAVSGSAATVNGSLVFGIGTQSNNGLGSATVYAIDSNLSFTVSYNGASYPGSFIDSGSNGYFFLDSSLSGLTDCPVGSIAQGFYCPASTKNFSATNQGVSGASGTVNFSIANAESLFANGNDTAFGQLGGPSIQGSSSGPAYFDWGLPFFYGRNVFTAIEGANTPGGAGPYWAY